MNIFAKIGATLALLLVLLPGGCSSETSSETKGAEEDQALFVALSGYGTCRPAGWTDHWSPLQMNMAAPVAELAQAYETRFGIRPVTLLGCHLLGENLFRFQTDLEEADHEGDWPEIARAIEARVGAHGSMPVYLIGYSYGGWAAMHLALSLDPALEIRGLFTLDPISRRCTITNFVANADCHEAPRDFDLVSRERIASRTKLWEQFYQTRSSWLSSSPIPQADENIEIDMDQLPWWNVTAHTIFDRDPRVWSVIRDKVTGTAGMAQDP